MYSVWPENVAETEESGLPVIPEEARGMCNSQLCPKPWRVSLTEEKRSVQERRICRTAGHWMAAFAQESGSRVCEHVVFPGG